MEHFKIKGSSWLLQKSLSNEEQLEDFDWSQLECEQVSLANLNEKNLELQYSENNLIQKRTQHQTTVFLDNQALSSFSEENESDNSSNNIHVMEQQKIQNEEPIGSNQQGQKRQMKRSNTTIAHLKIAPNFSREKIFLKKSKNKIERSFSIMQQQKSSLSKTVKLNQSQLKQVQVKYFNTHYCKTLKINEQMLAIEFIYLALKEYQNDEKMDQSLLLYPNYALAYQLKGLEDYFENEDNGGIRNQMNYNQRRPIQKSKSLDQEDDVDSPNLRVASQYDICQEDMSMEDQIIQIDFESKIQFKVVHLVPNPECDKFGLDLDIVGVTYKQHPELVIITIENPLNQSILHIKINPEQTLEDCFDDLIRKTSNKYSKLDYNLCLKFDCSNFGTDPLSLKLPISVLPIHWLVIVLKYQSQMDSSPKLTLTGSFIREDQCKETFISRSGAKSNRILSDDFQLLDKLKRLPQIYGYQEFSLVKKESNCSNKVIVAIDYFDFYYTYKVTRIKPFSLYRLAKGFVKQLFIDEEHKLKVKNYRRIPLIKIIQVKLTNIGDTLEVSYMKEDDNLKKLHFTYVKHLENIDLGVLQVQEAFTKLEYLVQQRTKYKHFNS